MRILKTILNIILSIAIGSPIALVIYVLLLDCDNKYYGCFGSSRNSYLMVIFPLVYILIFGIITYIDKKKKLK